MDTFPEWSPDGKYLYFCRAPQIGEEYDYREIRYSLYRFSFDSETRTAGEAELVFNADSMKKSISFPRISPDGKFLIATLADYGCFPVWHKEADLWSIDLSNGNISKLDLNSDLCDSYHSWSSNGRWIVFSSKRDDGLTARPYIAWIDADGKTGKPFILPQKDPDFYGNFLKTFNIPEFSNMDIKLNPGETRRLVNSKAIQAKWSGGK
jgi:Tol biopolymer transport system component